MSPAKHNPRYHQNARRYTVQTDPELPVTKSLLTLVCAKRSIHYPVFCSRIKRSRIVRKLIFVVDFTMNPKTITLSQMQDVVID